MADRDERGRFKKVRFDIENGITLCKDCHIGNGNHKKERLLKENLL